MTQIKMKGIERLADRLAACRQADESVCLYPHVNVDGDALGSSLALLLALQAIGVKACLPLDEPVPDKLGFLPALDHISWLDRPDVRIAAAGCRLALLIDCAEPSRLGQRRMLCEQAAELWVLDHHVARHAPGDRDIIDTNAAAVAELVYDLISALTDIVRRPLLDRTMARLLMTALVSDTGGFVYSNTKKRTFAIASHLMDDDIQLSEINYRLFQRSSQARLCLMARIFTAAVFACAGRIVLAKVSQEMIHACGADDNDLDGIISHLRNVSGIELAMILRSQSDGAIRVNIRSSPAIDAARFAGLFGGGGHPRAAGMTLNGLSLDDAAALILQKAGELL